MGWPQITYIVLMAMAVGVQIAKHGQPREPYSMWSALIGASIAIGLLYAGGFFNGAT